MSNFYSESNFAYLHARKWPLITISLPTSERLYLGIQLACRLPVAAYESLFSFAKMSITFILWFFDDINSKLRIVTPRTWRIVPWWIFIYFLSIHDHNPLGMHYLRLLGKIPDFSSLEWPYNSIIIHVAIPSFAWISYLRFFLSCSTLLALSPEDLM